MQLQESFSLEISKNEVDERMLKDTRVKKYQVGRENVPASRFAITNENNIREKNIGDLESFFTKT
jgi:hypothetical protein